VRAGKLPVPHPLQIEKPVKSVLRITEPTTSYPCVANQSEHLSKLKLKYAGKTNA